MADNPCALQNAVDIPAGDAAFRHLADVLPTGLAVFAQDGACVYANPRAAELLGSDRDALLGSGWWNAISPADLAAVTEAWSAARKTHTGYERRLRFSTSTGERWVLIRVAPVADGGWVVALDDHTAEVVAQREADEREAEFRLLAENSTDFIARLDARAVYQYVSPASRTLFGYEPHELVGRSTLDFIHPEDLERLLQAAPDPAEPDTTYTLRMRHKDGHYVWIETNSRAKVDPATNEIVEFHGTSRGIDDRVRAEDELRLSEGRFRSSFDDAPIGMTITMLDGRVERVNRAITEMLGYTEDEMTGITFADFTHPDDRQSDLAEMRRMANGETDSVRFEKRYIDAAGEPVDVELSVSLVRAPDGEPLHFVAQVFDLRERKRAQREADALKNEFFALVSHELRTPLTSISGYIDMLLDGEDGGDPVIRERFLRVAQRNTGRLQRLVADILFAAQIESGELPLEHGRADLTAICSDAVEAAKPRAADLGVELESRITTVAVMEGDADRLAQAVDNLLSNALKFTPAGGHVTLRITSCTDTWVIEVKDTGVGITPEAQARLFERFYRAPEATDVVGVGLGLTITRAIVEGHDGTIAVTSEPGKGSTFRVELPRSRRRA